MERSRLILLGATLLILLGTACREEIIEINNAGEFEVFVADALLNGGRSGNFRLLEQATTETIRTPQVPEIDNSVGLHFFLLDSQNGLWGHDGGEQGVATIMGFNPRTRTGAIVLTNQGEADLDELFVRAYQFGLKL